MRWGLHTGTNISTLPSMISVIWEELYFQQIEHSLELESLRLSLNNMHRAQLELVQSNLQREKEECLAELREVLNDKRRQEVAVLQNKQQIGLEHVREQNQQQMEQSLKKHQQEIGKVFC